MMNVFNSIINDLQALQGATVRVFGQPTTLDTGVTDSDILIDSIDIAKALQDYEVDADEYYFYEEDENGDEFERYIFEGCEDIDSMITALEEFGYIRNECDYKADNSYNWGAPVSHDFDFRVYEDIATGGLFVEISFHRFGDVRGNYTDSALLHFSNDYEFYEVVSDCRKFVTVEIDGIMYDIEISPFSDVFEVYDDNGSYICEAYGDIDDITEKIRECVAVNC